MPLFLSELLKNGLRGVVIFPKESGGKGDAERKERVDLVPVRKGICSSGRDFTHFSLSDHLTGNTRAKMVMGQC